MTFRSICSFQTLRRLPRLAVTTAIFLISLGTAIAQELASPTRRPAAVDARADGTAEDKAAENHAAEEEPSYVRVKKEDGKPVAMQTAIVRYQGQPGSEFENKVVDLFGVVHIGQAKYYAEVDRRLGEYDVVLYELVAPDGTRIRPEDLEARRGLLSSMQTGMKDMLNLEYQLEKIDYLADNFRHADMSPEEFTEDLARRGDSVFKMIARMMGASLAAQSSGGGDVGILMALMSEDRPKLMKRAMAKQLVNMESVTMGMQDANGDDTLIKGRNAKAMKILREELSGDRTEAAVFYGAGHLPDMAERLENEFDMAPIGTTWLDAWDLTRN